MHSPTFPASPLAVILAVVAIAMGTAFGSAALFGVSLALGAFLAGVVVSESEVGHQVLVHPLHTARGMHIAWRAVPVNSPLVGHSLAEVNLRARSGASVIALIRDQQMLANPRSSTVFEAEDLVGLIGESEDVAAAERLIAGEPDPYDATVTPALLGQPGEAGAAI